MAADAGPSAAGAGAPDTAAHDPLHRLLAEIAQIASGYGMTGMVDAIADALAADRPDDAMPAVIRAAARLNAGRYDEAERILRDEGVSKPLAGATAAAHLGLALRLQGRAAESERVLREAADGPDDGIGVAMARRLLGAGDQGG
jgi:hypothetical protein